MPRRARGCDRARYRQAVALDPVPPPDPRDPILRLDNVILSGHALNWTEELDRALGQMNIVAVRAMLAGEMPPGIANASVTQDPRFVAKVQRLALLGHKHRSNMASEFKKEDGA